MTSGLDFSALDTLGGPATRLPRLLKRLNSKSAETREYGYSDLKPLLVGDVECSACVPAASVLWDQLGRAPKPGFQSSMIVDALTGGALDHLRGVGRGLSVAGARLVESRRDEVLGWLGHKSGLLRGSAALLASFYLEDAEVTGALLSCLESERALGCRVQLLVTLGGHGRAQGSGEVRRVLESVLGAGGVESGAAALGLLLLDAEQELGPLSDGLRGWLSQPETDYDGTPILVGLHPSTVSGLRPIPGLVWGVFGGGARGRLVSWLVSQRHDTTPGVEAQVSRLLFEALSLTEARRVLEASELTSGQRELLSLISDSWSAASAGYGLPAAGVTRRRWLGLEPPGPLEREVEGRPVWRWLREAPRPSATESAIPEALDVLSPLDRFEALARHALGSYWGGLRLSSERLEDEVARVEGEEGAFERIESIASDVAVWRAAVARQGNPADESPVGSLLLTLPWVRSGRRLSPSLGDLLGSHGAEFAQFLEVFKTLSEAERVDFLLAPFKRRGVSFNFKGLLKLIDANVDPRVLQAIRRYVHHERPLESDRRAFASWCEEHHVALEEPDGV